MKRLFAFLTFAVEIASPVLGTEIVVTLNESNRLQTMDGFGASLTDSSAWLLNNALTESQRTHLVNDLFSPTNGIGLSILRQPIGASDFRVSNYTYDDMPAGQTDYALTNFSIAHDEEYIVPLLKQALSVNPDLKIMGTPWSAPAWMKDSGDFYYGALKPNCYEVYAKYFLRYVQSFESNGLPIFAVSLQNEPLYEPYSYPGMRMEATNQARFAVLVGQQFESNGIATKILAYDHNWDRFEYPMTVLSNGTANPYIFGAAFHAYAGDVSAQSIVHNAFTNKGIYFTENTAGSWSGSFGDILMWDANTLIIGGIRNWSKTIIKWNLALDQNGGPAVTGGCSGCRGLLTILTNTHTIVTNADFYSMAHASKFVKPGAYCIEATESPADGPYSVAFINPDSNLVVIAVNDAPATRNFTLRWQDQSISVPLPAGSLTTFTWPNTMGATADVWMTTSDQSKLFQKQSPAVFRPLEIQWKGRTWTVRDEEGTPGNNFWSADCVHVDTNDWLRLLVKTNSTMWYDAQVESADSPSFGTYRWCTVGGIDRLDSNVVGNLSIFANITHELNIQFASAYDDTPTNFINSVQPYYLSGHRNSYALTLTNAYTTHEFSWNPRTVVFRSWYGHSNQPSNSNDVFQEWTYEGSDVPGLTNQHVRMNLWQYNGASPSSNQELVLADFIYQCSTGTILYDDFENGILGASWTSFGEGTFTETGGHLAIMPTEGKAVGCRSTNQFSWAMNGLSYVFSANIATIDVTTACTGGPDLWAYEAILSNDGADPYAAAHAVILRTGYNSSSNQLILELLTKENSANSWGTSRFIGTIDHARTLFNGGEGLELRFALVYSNYVVGAFYQGNPVSVSIVSGTTDSPHGLNPTNFTNGLYVVGAVNNDVGRGTVFWEQIHAHADAELTSTAPSPDSDGTESTLVQIGNANAANSWRNPVGTRYNKLRSQVLYRASQINQSGLITQVQVRVLAPPALPLRGFTIRMQNTTLSNLSSSFINTGWTTNYQADTTIANGFNGWYSFSLSSNFYYKGTNHLLLDFIVNNTSRDDSPIAASTYTAGTGIQGNYGGHNSGDPFTWTSSSGLKYKYTGANFCDVRLAISNDQPIAVGQNLSFDDGPRGYLTNVPGWKVSGSVMSGYIKGSPVYHGPNSLKLWKNGGNGDQSVYQFFSATATNQYTLGGYLLSQSMDPFVGSNAYGALLLEWYGNNGLLRRQESDHFTPTNLCNIWTYYEIKTVPPANTTSGRIVCALFSCNDQEGYLYFDRLSMNVGEAPAPTGAAPVAAVYSISDEFNDNTISNIWIVSWGDGADAYTEETNGYFGVKPGIHNNQSSGYTTPVSWNNTSCWYVFNATLSTIQLESVQSGNDIAVLLGVCSQPDNPWWCTNSIGLYGYYDQDEDQFWWEFLTKSDAPANSGTECFSCTMQNASKYMDGTNRIRISIALGLDSYEIQFNDHQGLPVPYELNNGSPQGHHNIGDRLNHSYWYVGAQADGTNRGWVYWDRTDVHTTLAPTCSLLFAAQTSTDGSGIVTVSNRVCDPNGDVCRLRVQASTNGGTSWFHPWGSSVTSTDGAELAPTQQLLHVVAILTTNENTFVTITNQITFSWATRSDCNGFSLGGEFVSNVLVRITADDGDVSSSSFSSQPFMIDNQPPRAQDATILIQDGALWTFNTNLATAWSGFIDEGAGISGYYYSLVDGGGTTSGIWTTGTQGLISCEGVDVDHTIYVWGSDVFGNIGTAASNHVAVLSLDGDYDHDGLSNTNEPTVGANPLDSDSDDDSMSDGWEISNGYNPTNSADADNDTDGDGYSNRQEFYCDTEPSNTESHLFFKGTASDAVIGPILSWNSSTGRVYSLYYNHVPNALWQPLAGHTNVPGTGGTMTFTGTVESATYGLYKLGIRFP